MATVLIVDDVDYIRKSIARVLEHNGFVCDVCSDGQKAIERVKEHRYDLIITDIMMPEADGYEFMDFLRTLPGNRSNTPVLAISGGDKTINADIALEIIQKNANGVLSKPFAKTDLLNAVAKVIGRDKYDQIVRDANVSA